MRTRERHFSALPFLDRAEKIIALDPNSQSLYCPRTSLTGTWEQHRWSAVVCPTTLYDQRDLKSHGSPMLSGV